ncbi:TetR/AcrR family transcriptional regulator [Yinghuangia sp. ASG 101]|uniref:TetR/AcrR family transcriptional regulator n=1 Tax=Yinghuangia sp. ASG 101 TaxID=2896848 RepID=UPI001E45EDF1|nr:TetR/AcrR family transcriptional regulator [Yinghuangia sp. ASG 101]UGQ11870.1 TetR/AcrR family transcriptional regulator [Yinghuangia sp. ASG 101]
MTEARGRRGPYRKSIERREHILDAALEVFAEHGDGGALLQEIADRVGVKLPSLMYYFPSRDELLLAVVERRDTLGAKPAGEARDPIESAGDTIRRGMAQPGLVKLVATMATAAADPAHPGHLFFIERYRRMSADVARTLKADQDRGTVRGDASADHMARLLLAAIDGLLRQWLIDPSTDPVPALETFVRLCGYAADADAEART